MSTVAYTPRDPTASVLYTVVREHVETFRIGAARLRDGQGLPRFVDAEFAAFLRCGFLAGGFARFRCDACRSERLVAFSCKGRGFCPSCGGRRMAERAAQLVDHVLPDVPVRQWVLGRRRSVHGGRAPAGWVGGSLRGRIHSGGIRAAAPTASGRRATVVGLDTAKLPRALGRVRSPRGRPDPGRPAQPPRTGLPLRAPAARGR